MTKFETLWASYTPDDKMPWNLQVNVSKKVAHKRRLGGSNRCAETATRTEQHSLLSAKEMSFMSAKRNFVLQTAAGGNY